MSIRRTLFILLVCNVIFKVNVVTADCPHEDKSLKDWSNKKTWSGGKPIYNASVVIEGKAILLDESPPELFSLTIRSTGRLVWKPNVGITLKVSYIWIEGSMEIGSADCLYEGNARIILTGKRGDYEIPHGMKAIIVPAGGSLELHGQQKLPWTKLDQTLQKSTTSFNHLESITENEDDHDWQNAITVYVFSVDTETNMPVLKRFEHFGLQYSWQKENKILEFQVLMNDVENGDVVMLAKQQKFKSHPDYNDVFDAFEKMAFGSVTGKSKLRSISKNDAYAAVIQKELFPSSLLSFYRGSILPHNASSGILRMRKSAALRYTSMSGVIENGMEPLEGRITITDDYFIWDERKINMEEDFLIQNKIRKYSTSTVVEVLVEPTYTKMTKANAILDYQQLKFNAISYVHSTKDWESYDDFRVLTYEEGYPKLTLIDDATQWNAGDTVIVTSTDYDWEQAEEATIVKCDDCSSNQIRIDLDTQFVHWGEILDNVDQRAEVALLTRNIVIEGEMENECYVDDPSSPGKCSNFKYDTFGGHIKILMNFTAAHIEGVELIHMGQQTDLGRYPIHFHMCRDVEGAYIRETSVHHSFARCITVHGTHKLEITDSVCYHVLGHGYFIEDGGERETVLDGNLVASVRKGKLLPSDKTPTGFWMTNPLSNLTNCVAAGGQGMGIWYLYPPEPIGTSEGLGFMAREEARHTAITLFDNNVAHSNDDTGLFLDHILLKDGSTRQENKYSYMPKVDPLDADSEDKMVYIYRLTAYKNRGNNVWSEGGGYHFVEASLSDSVRSITNARANDQHQYISNSVIVGESANLGEPEWFEINDTWVMMSRSYPFSWDRHMPRNGFLFYNGPSVVNNVWFNNFKNTEDYKMGAIGFHREFHASASTVTSVKSVNFGFSDSEETGNRVFDGDDSFHGFSNTDADISQNFQDVYGDVAGISNAQVVKHEQFHITPECKRRPNWGTEVYCPHDYGKLRVEMNDEDFKQTFPMMTRDDTWAELTMTEDEHSNFIVILGQGYSYLLHWTEYTPEEFRITSDGFEKDKWVRFGVCLPRGATFELWTYAPYWLPEKEDWTVATSIADLENTVNDGRKYFHDKVNDIVYFKFVNLNERAPDDIGPCPKGPNSRWCPLVEIFVSASDYTDSSCKERLGGKTTEITLPDDTTVLTNNVVLSPPEGLGAGATKPFKNRAAVDGGYGEWSEWSECTRSCGGGTMTRSRECDSPPPSNGGLPCVGENDETKTCNDKKCKKINGKFTGWSKYSKCEEVADCQGFKKKTRSCTKPAPSNGGKYCKGPTEFVQPCKAC